MPRVRTAMRRTSQPVQMGFSSALGVNAGGAGGGKASVASGRACDSLGGAGSRSGLSGEDKRFSISSGMLTGCNCERRTFPPIKLSQPGNWLTTVDCSSTIPCQRLPCIRLLHPRYRFRRTLGYDAAAIFAAFGAEVDQPIGVAD